MKTEMEKGGWGGREGVGEGRRDGVASTVMECVRFHHEPIILYINY